VPAPVIIATGVSRGIGRAIAEQLQSRGADVVGAARNVADVPATASLFPVAADVTQETGRKAIVEAGLARYGRIDGLVNNVGAAFRRASVDTALEDFRQMLEVNLLSTFALCCAVYRHLKASRGSVVNVSSVTLSRVLPARTLLRRRNRATAAVGLRVPRGDIRYQATPNSPTASRRHTSRLLVGVSRTGTLTRAASFDHSLIPHRPQNTSCEPLRHGSCVFTSPT
jgi:NAD(P)-dependent dehydrogenase (short-subunit alcohol dehydrogenase family)